ncbi:RsiV family protein [Ectopseudomonas mendocina]|uniref:RsiV family protein n=1 Tax=Ectopseudomonas mendocina TaxID=300 RepID=A0ABZ2RDX2_ECTME
MQLVKIAYLISFSLLLAACQSIGTRHTDIKYTRHATEEVKAGCQGEQCPLVNIDTLNFPSEPNLNALIEKRLLEMTRLTPDQQLAPTLADYTREYLRDAPDRNSTYLQAKVREQHDGLVVIEFATYLDTGGAHGMPGRGFINYSIDEDRALTLADMLIPGQEDAFWNAVKVAHNSWLIHSRMDRDPEFVKNWPFVRSPNVAFLKAGALVKYDVYAIAPYSMGHIELLIPYKRLTGILKPEKFPAQAE